MSDIRAIERELIEIAYEQVISEGQRRIPLEWVLALPAVKPHIHGANEIPDDLVRVLTELKEDSYINLHDITITPLLGNEWAVGISRRPSISLTDAGKSWVAEQVASKSRQPASPSEYQQGSDTLSINPSAFDIPTNKEHSEPGLLVAVMIPFKKEFEDVYRAIESVCKKLGFTARKADDMWEHQDIIQDIFTLLYQAEIVVVDFSGSNPNVMYETGIAHTLGKEVVPLAQNIESDVPFDMRHRRVLEYAANKQGL